MPRLAFQAFEPSQCVSLTPMMPLGTSQPTEVQEWNTLRAWLKEDPQGTALLERLQRDPIGTQQELKDWLLSRSKEAPASISTLIAGGNVEKLVNIASANNVIFNLTANPQALHQLPPDISEFTGRQSELERTIKALQPKDANAIAPVLGISGMPGVGKSALAIHACHQLRDAFPDAQLYVNLRGDSSTNAVKPADAAATLLLSLGMSESGMAADLDGRASQLRGLLSGRRVLVLLDNARSEDQVRPLIPASGNCAVLVTSRAPLSALGGTTQISLDVLDSDEGLELLTRIAGADRIAQDRESSERLVSLAGGLPLALRILGGTLLSHGHRSIKSQVSILEDQKSRLAKLKLGDLEVRSSFDTSYSQLSSEEQQLFRYLGALPGPILTLDGISAMLTVSQAEAQERLDPLIVAQLIEPVGDLIFRLHDLMRLFAREKFHEEPPEEQKRFWQKLAADYRTMVLSAWYYISTKRLSEVTTTQQAKEQQHMWLGAMSWFDLERANLATIIGTVHAEGNDELFLALSHPFLQYLSMRGRSSEGIALAEKVGEVARKAADSRTEAAILNTIGALYSSESRWAEAKKYLQQALDFVRADKRREDELGILMNLSQIQASLHEMDDALRNSKSVIEGYRTEFPDNKTDYSSALQGQGNILISLGRFLEAVPIYEEALKITEETQDISLRATILLNLGTAFRSLGKLDKALEAYSAAAALRTFTRDYNSFANALTNLANVYNSQGQFSEGVNASLQALKIYREFHDKMGESDALNILGVNYTDLGQWADAENSLRESFAIRESLNSKKGMADVLANVGNLESGQSRWKNAIAKFNEARNIYEELGIVHQVADMTMNIGNGELQLGEFDKAVVNLEIALVDFKSRGEDPLTARGLLNLGLAYFHLQEPTKAWSNYQEAYKMFRQIGDPQGVAATAHNIAKLFAEAGELKTAIDWFAMDLQICEEIGDRPGAMTTLFQIAICQLQLSDFAAAEPTLNKYLKLSRELSDPLAEGRALANLASIAYQRGNKERALELGSAGLEILAAFGDSDAPAVANFLEEVRNS